LPGKAQDCAIGAFIAGKAQDCAIGAFIGFRGKKRGKAQDCAIGALSSAFMVKNALQKLGFGTCVWVQI
jgi:hypothetical protein